jgi:hypothetical protein
MQNAAEPADPNVLADACFFDSIMSDKKVRPSKDQLAWEAKDAAAQTPHVRQEAVRPV